MIAALSQNSKPTPFHHMIAYLAEERDRRLHRCYTLNIDGMEDSFKYLETNEPLDSKEKPLKVQLHGNLRYTRCTLCTKYYTLDPPRHLNFIDLECTPCVVQGMSRRRRPTFRAIRPNVVLYGSDLNPNAAEIMKMMKSDWGNQNCVADRLIVVGTSAKVGDVQRMIMDCGLAVKARGGKVIWIGLGKPPPDISEVFDEILLCDCQVVAYHFFEDIDFSKIATKWI